MNVINKIGLKVLDPYSIDGKFNRGFAVSSVKR